MDTILINELFGPTIQGEGPDIGKPCLFIRTQGCPVKCPGCDTAFTWNGTEKGFKLPIYGQQGKDTPLPQNVAARAPETLTIASLRAWLDAMLGQYPGCGLVLSGGEPLVHYKNAHLIMALSQTRAAWKGLETSGFIGKGQLEYKALNRFLGQFDTVCVSPKVTSCLHGEGWTDSDLLKNVEDIKDAMWQDTRRLVFKFVVKGEADIREVLDLNELYSWTRSGYRVYLMPYGQESGEVMAACRDLIPTLARTGFILSPRLHSMLWGKERGR